MGWSRRGSCLACDKLATMQSPPCLKWVKTGNTRSEQMTSALPPKADLSRTSGHVRFVPQAEVNGQHLCFWQRIVVIE